MDMIISFFRDTLSGPLYIVIVVVAVILFFACIGYLAERKLKLTKEQNKYAQVGSNEVVLSETIEEVAPTVTPQVVVKPPIMEVPTVAATTVREVVASPTVVTSPVVSEPVKEEIPVVTPAVTPVVPVAPVLTESLNSFAASQGVVPVVSKTTTQVPAVDVVTPKE